ncbi:MAG: efflux RND transporter periplasmic adaptor subunit [Bacteroidetes bacterium]|nr:efflux RND transporter periplasmic adaptor subunit [Bacteroidota bacterium]
MNKKSEQKMNFKEKLKLFIGGIFVLLAISITLYFLREENKNKTKKSNKIYATYKNIIQKEVIFGTIQPLKEIAIKPRISGILEKIYVHEGSKIKKGTPIARIKPLPNPKNIEKAKTDYNVAKLNKELAYKEYIRAKRLIKDHIISKQNFQNLESNYKKANENLKAALKHLELVKKGYFKGQEEESNIVNSTIDGTILELPFKEGSSIIERSLTNEGSTIAIIADMNEMIFKGNVNEKEVALIKEDMKFTIDIDSLNRKNILAVITKISPKGKIVDGVTKFMIEADIKTNSKNILRAGYKATANIIISQKDNVLTIPEKYLKFEDDKIYIEIDEKGKNVKRYIETGISDGIDIEVKKGLTEKDAILLPFED